MIALLLLFCCVQEVPDLGTRKDGADWPCFLGPEHNGTSPEKGLVWPPRFAWELELGESYGPPAVARGRLYVFDRSGALMRLRSVHSETGKPLWTFTYPAEYQDSYGADNGPRCSPVIDGDRVYILGPEGLLHCLKAVDGSLLWKKATSADFGVVPNFFGVGSTPLVEGELLIVQVGGSPADSPPVASGETRGAGSGIVAFDKRTSAEKYRITDELASYSSPTAATIQGRRWAFVFTRGALVGFEPASGKIDFQFPWRAKATPTVNIANPVVSGDLVAVSEAYGVGTAVVRVKPGGYDVVWQDGRKRDRALMAYWNTPLCLDGHLYGADGMGGAELRCVEMASGALKWADPKVPQSSLLAVDGRVVALGVEGTLRLLRLSPEKCEILGQQKLAGLNTPARAAPILSHGLLYVRGNDLLRCFELIPAANEFDLLILKYSEALKTTPKDENLYSQRGDAYFYRGRFAEALADYERMVELDPAQGPGHWRRGIAAFYAGDFKKAARQFEEYRTTDDVDRENGIWRYFSQAKADGFEKARAGLLKYAKDDREPFPSVYQLFEGKITPAKILEPIESPALDAQSREMRLFYAHLYIGLNHWVEGRNDDAIRHLRLSTANTWGPVAGYGPSYMWHVGRLTLEKLEKR